MTKGKKKGCEISNIQFENAEFTQFSYRGSSLYIRLPDIEV